MRLSTLTFFLVYYFLPKKDPGGAVWTKSANEQVAIVFGGNNYGIWKRQTYSFNSATGKFEVEPGLELPFYTGFSNPTVQTVDGAVYAMGMDILIGVNRPVAVLFVLEKFGTSWTLADETRCTSHGNIQRFFLITTWNPPIMKNP